MYTLFTAKQTLWTGPVWGGCLVFTNPVSTYDIQDQLWKWNYNITIIIVYRCMHGGDTHAV